MLSSIEHSTPAESITASTSSVLLYFQRLTLKVSVHRKRDFSQASPERFKLTILKYLWTKSRALNPTEDKKRREPWKAFVERQYFKYVFWMTAFWLLVLSKPCWRYNRTLDRLYHIDISSIFITSEVRSQMKITVLEISSKNHGSSGKVT